LSKCTKK